MRRIRLKVLAGILALTFVGCDGGTSLRGSIKDSGGRPITGALIVLASGSHSSQGWSAHDGSYKISLLHAPFKVELRLTVTKEGYRSFEKRFFSTDHLETVDVQMTNVSQPAEP